MNNDNKDTQYYSGAEEAIRRNLIAIKDFTQESRKLVEGLQKDMTNLKLQFIEQQKQINMYKNQIANLQQKLYK